MQILVAAPLDDTTESDPTKAGLREPWSDRLSIGESSGPIHPVPTRNRNHGYRYLFYDKHHGKDRNAARWLPDLSREDEFAVFDDADFHEIVDDRGWLYGIRSRGEDDRIPVVS